MKNTTLSRRDDTLLTSDFSRGDWLPTIRFVPQGQHFITIVLIILLLLIPHSLLHAQIFGDSDFTTAIEDYFEARQRTLFVKAETVRFLNTAGQTEFHLNFKIPNNEMQFLQTSDGYVAHLEVSCDIFREDVLIKSEKYTVRPAAQTVGIAQSANHYYLDKIELTIDRNGLSAVLEITDRNASKYYSQKFELNVIDPSAMVSDIEISHGISTDHTTNLERFTRGQYQFYVDPIPIIDGDEKHFIAYYQVSNIPADSDGIYIFFEYLKVKKGEDIVWESEYNHTIDYLPYQLIKRIQLGDWASGLYTLEATIESPKNQKRETTERHFSLTRKFTLLTQRVFSDDEEEFQLISYFLNSRQRRQWRNLNEVGKKGFIERFWNANNPNPYSEDNQFLTMVRQRVNEANWRFSHHRQGWTSDMGRIYIKYGPPDEQNKRETEVHARYSRRPYQVWKYDRAGRSYLFLDFQGNGNYRLIHAVNDETESTDPGWKTYFELDLDERTLGL